MEVVANDFADMSYYVCYGEVDVIIQMIGDDTDIERFDLYLDGKNYPYFRLGVDNIPYYFGHTVSSGSDLRKPNLTPEIVDQALSTNISNTEIIEELFNSGVILGQTFYENTHLTGRVRAYIGIEFDFPLKRPEQTLFESSLGEINKIDRQNRLAEPIVTVYRCAGIYDYLLEVICDDQLHLDQFTDNLLTLSPSVSDTVTSIVAKSSLQVPRYSAHQQDVLVNFQKLAQVNSMLSDLLENLRNIMPQDLQVVLLASQTRQFHDALKLYDELIYNNPAVSDDILVHFFELLRGLLKEKPTIIKNAGLGLIREVVEPEHNAFFETLLKIFFQNDANQFQKEIKTDNNIWWKWGLSKWADIIYPKWNKHQYYGIAIKIPDEILLSLSLVGSMRNDFAHVRSKKVSVDILVNMVRETFNHSYRILEWVSEMREKFENPTFQEMVQLIAEVNYERKDADYQILMTILATQSEQLEFLEAISNQADERWDALNLSISELLVGNRTNLSRTLTLVEELVIPRIRDKDKTTTQRTIEFLRNSSISLPENIIANIIAGLCIYAIGIS